MPEEHYLPPEIWVWENESEQAFSDMNRPSAGARFEKPLPRGKHPLQLYSLGTPNGAKITILLEELLAAGHTTAEYDAWLIDIGKGEQFSSGFVSLNPNSKIPVLADCGVQPQQRVFESGSILLYLAEKFSDFIPTDSVDRVECLNWLFWQAGSTPLLGGGFGHFYSYAPIKIKYAIDRYTIEVKRQLDVLDQHLADHRYFCGDAYTIADIAIFPWYGGLVNNRVYGAAKFIQAENYTNLMRWASEVNERPAVKRGMMVNRPFGKKSRQLLERHDNSDFELRTQDILERDSQTAS